MRGILTRLRVWRHWRREQRELAEEMEAHREMKRLELERAGTPAARLAGAARGAMGHDTHMLEEARGVWLWPWLEALGQGLRQGARRLRRAPGFTAAAILTLALGIGANTAVFSVVEAVMLRPLPYPQASRLVGFDLAERSGPQPNFSLPQIEYLHGHVRGVSPLADYRGGGTVALRHGTETDWADGMEVGASFFRVLGVEPRLGRDFAASDDQPSAGGTIILSDRLWREGFGASPKAVGTLVQVNHQAYLIVGVMPPRFEFEENPADFYLALIPDGTLGDLGLNTNVIGRLRPGATLAGAQAEVAALVPGMRARGMLGGNMLSVGVSNYQALVTSSVRLSLWLLLGAVGLLLVIACANVAGLILARTLARRPEIAMRRALGASRGRLLVQFFAEGLVLSACGGLAGLGLAEATLRGLAAKLPSDVPLAGPIALDGRVLLFTLAMALGASIVCGLAGAWQAGEGRLMVGPFARRGWARDVLAVGEVALALILLAGAGLLVRSLIAIEIQPLGFDPTGRTLFVTQLPPGAASDAADAWRFDRQVIARLDQTPGVAAAVVNVPPLGGQSNIPGEPVMNAAQGTAVEFRRVSPGYFAAMGIPLQAGRDVDTADTAAAPAVAVVSENLARQWFHGQALGKQVRMGVYGGRVFIPGLAARPETIVGIVGDVKVQDVRQPARLTVYVPAAQQGGANTSWVVRGTITEGGIRAAVREVNVGARVAEVEPYAALVAHTEAQPRFEARLTGLFALLALALAAVGLYGLLAYTVAERAREIGIRMALGARRGTILRQVAGRGMALALAGIAAGLLAALPLARLMASLLFGVKPLDAATLAAAAGALALVALGASLLPARRATRVDPALALRNDS